MVAYGIRRNDRKAGAKLNSCCESAKRSLSARVLMKAIRIHNHGGPEVLAYEDVPIPEPRAGEARVKIEASGVNFIDIYHRIGLYPMKTPLILGSEGAGIVDAVGDGVTEVKKGDRVAYAMVPGSY